jgi:hypothetical protein
MEMLPPVLPLAELVAARAIDKLLDPDGASVIGEPDRDPIADSELVLELTA